MSRPRYILLVLDGVADSVRYRPTSLELANTPGLDSLVRMAVCGGFYPIDSSTPPESDAAVFSILGYDPHRISVVEGFSKLLELV